MRGYDTLTKLRQLTPEQLDNWLQYFWGKIGCDFDGFRDSESRPEFPYAKYVADQADESFQYISMRPDLHRVTKTEPMARQLISDTCNIHKCDLVRNGMFLHCPRCKHEADHPPIQPLGHDNLSAEDLQRLHQQVSGNPMIATADSIENSAYSPPEVTQWKSGMGGPVVGVPYDGGDGGPIPSQAVVDAYELGKQHGASRPKEEMIDGLLVSTDTLAYHLIPVVAIERLCERIMYGEQTKKEHAWNALSKNQEVLDSRPALARRFGHGINHAYRLLGKIQRGEPWTEEDEREASAVMWAGMYAIAAINQQRKKQCPQPNSSESNTPT